MHHTPSYQPVARPLGVESPELPSQPDGVRLTTLPNGLTLIVREDHSAPVVSAQAWCRAGSVDEGKWLGAGLSHVLEHMLFKGTATRGLGQIEQTVHDAGGTMNAYTSFDRTVYWIDVPDTGASVAIDILCDIMQHATLPEEELGKEMDVIRREMDMYQDDPGRRSSRRLFEVAYTVSPYRFTIIGYPDIFDELKREDILGYYRDKYIPNNVFLVVVGDVRAETVEAQIMEHFGKAKSRPVPAVVLPVEPRQIASREIIEEAPIQLGHFHMSWHIPEIRHPDLPALEVLATLLGSGRSSRLYQQVRERSGLVHSVNAWTYSPGHPGLIGVSAVVDADKFPAARVAILAEFEAMKEAEVSDEELGKAVKQFTAGALSTRKTMHGQAQDLGGNWMVAGDLNFSARFLAAATRVTGADLRRVARQYLTVENRTLYALLPTGAAPKTTAVPELLSAHEIKKIELPNGLRLLLKEDHRLPFVQFRAVFRGGVAVESAANAGLTQLASRILLKGTQRRSSEQIAHEIESIGGSIDTYGGNNSFGVSAEVLSGDFDLGLDLFADVLLHPAFPAPALEREREVQLAAIRAQKDQVFQTGLRALRRTLFGDIGYGLDTSGVEASVNSVQVGDLNAFHQQWVAPRNCVIAIYGDIRPEQVKQAVERHFGTWPAAGAAPTIVASPRRVTAATRVNEVLDKKQSVILVGFLGGSLRETDRFALEVLQETCSDLGSRLFQRIRDELGLAYYVGAQNFLGWTPGYFAFYAGTAPDKLAQVEHEVVKEVESLRASGITAEELKRSKAKIIGHRKISRQELGGLAMTTALDELYGLGYDNNFRDDAAYEEVTLEQVRAVAQKYLDLESVVIATAGPKPE